MDMFWLLVWIGLGMVAFAAFIALVGLLAKDHRPKPSIRLDTARRPTPGTRPNTARFTGQPHGVDPSVGADDMRRVADAMGVTIEDARYIFDSVGSVSAGEIVEGLSVDRETRGTIEEAARTDEDWWRPKSS